MGKLIELLTPHYCYQSLGKVDEKRQEVYKSLPDQQIPGFPVKEIRVATNKACVLGNYRIKQKTERQTGRRVSPQMRGGDRKSEKYKANQ